MVLYESAHTGTNTYFEGHRRVIPEPKDQPVSLVADSEAFMLADLKRSGLTPADFPLPPTPQTAINGVARYRIPYPCETGFWKDRHDRVDNKYTRPKGHATPLYWTQDPDEFFKATINASVEGAKSALAFRVATGIATAGLDSCWGWGEPLTAGAETDDADDGPQRVLRQELRQGFGQRRVHLVLMDGDWSTNLNVARALATYVWEAEQWGSQILCIDLGHDAEGARLGFDDWLADKYGTDRSKWPTQDEMRKAVLSLPRIDVSELPLPSSWFLETDDRFNRGHMDFSDRGNATLWLRILGPNNVKYLADLKEWLTWDRDQKRWKRAPGTPLELVNCAARRRQLMADKLFQQYREMLAAGTDKDDPKAERLMAEAKRWLDSANRLSSVPGRKAVLEDASARAAVVCRSTDFDRDTNLLAVQNGIIDLRTGELRDEVQEDKIRNRCATSYTPDEPQGEWAMKTKAFVQQITAAAHGLPDPESERYLRRRVGAALRGSNTLTSLEIAFGSGANGKTVLFKLIQNLLGDYAVSLPAATVLSSYARRDPESASPFLMMAVGKRIVILSETNDTAVLDEAKVKALTGDDMLTIRGNYKDGGEYTITFTVFLLTNSLPGVAAGDLALWDRLAPFHFRCRWRREAVVAVDDADAGLPPADLSLRDVMPSERGAQEWLLWWAVRGGVEWSGGGLGAVPDHLRLAAETYKESQNKLGRWLEESGLELDPDSNVPSRQVYQTYVAFCAEENVQALKSDNFLKRMYGHFPQLTAGKSNGVRTVKGVRLKVMKMDGK